MRKSNIVKRLLEAKEYIGMYGGLPDVINFYGANTEYEIGIQRAVDSLRCILGSLCKVEVNIINHGDSLETALLTEKSHIREEIGIVKKVLAEYSKPLYTDEWHFRSPYKEKSLESLIAGSEKLKKIANGLKNKMKSNPGFEELYSLAKEVFDTMIVFSDAAIKATGKDGVKNNLYKDSQLNRAVSALDKSILKLLG